MAASILCRVLRQELILQEREDEVLTKEFVELVILGRDGEHPRNVLAPPPAIYVRGSECRPVLKVLLDLFDIEVLIKDGDAVFACPVISCLLTGWPKLTIEVKVAFRVETAELVYRVIRACLHELLAYDLVRLGEIASICALFSIHILFRLVFIVSRHGRKNGGGDIWVR